MALSTIATLMNAVVGLLSIPFITRHVSSEDFGHISLILLIFYLFAFLDGLQPVVINFTCSRAYEKADMVRTFSIFAWLMGVATFIVAFTALGLLYRDTFSGIEMMFIAVSGMLYFPMTNEGALLEARQRVGLALILRSAGWAIVYITFIFYVIFDLSFEYYTFSLVAMNGLLMLGYRFANADEPRHGRFKQNIMREMAIEVKRVVMFNLCVAVTNFSDRLFISRFFPLEKLGYYSVQYELGSKTYLLPYIVSKVLYPDFSKRLALQERTHVLNEWKHVTKLVFFTTFSISLIAFNFSEDIIRIYAGNIYSAYSYVFMIIMIGITINSLGFMAILYQRAKGDFASQEKAYYIGSIIGLVSIYPLIRGWGLLGAALVYLCMRSADVLLILNMRKEFSEKPKRMMTMIIWPLLFAGCYVLLYLDHYLMFGVCFIFFAKTLIEKDDISFVRSNFILKSLITPSRSNFD